MEAGAVTERSDRSELRRDALGVPGIVFFVIAAAAPLTVVVGVPPIIFGVAENRSAALSFLLSGVVLLLFSVGYAAMSRFISGPAGFAVYVERAFGRRVGAGAAFLAVLSYGGFLLGVYGVFGFLAAPLLKDKLSIDLPWWAWAFVALAAAGVLGYREVNLSARVLGVLLLAEVVIVLVMDAAIIVQGGDNGLTTTGFSVSQLFDHAPGVVLLFAIASFVGFEATTLYGEEARDRHVTIPRATYVAVVAITAFYVLTFWAIGLGYGDNVVKSAQKNSGTFVFDLGDRYLGGAASDIMNWLVLSSIFAAILAFHNAISRYLFALGRGRLLPQRLGTSHQRFLSPHIASVVTSVIAVVVIAIFALAHGDPYLQLYGWFIGVGTVGILLLYTSGALSVLGFLRRQERDQRLWHSLIAPALAAAGLITMTYLAIHNFSTLTSSTNDFVNLLWLLPPLAAVVGFLVASVRRASVSADDIQRSLSGESAAEPKPPTPAGISSVL